MAAAPPPKKRKIYCNHCEKEVSKSTWYCHYAEFFDSVTGEWKTEVKQRGAWQLHIRASVIEGEGTCFESQKISYHTVYYNYLKTL